MDNRGVLIHQVSIHAPAKGRRQAWELTELADWFQSTPPRRGDECKCDCEADVEGFNPRPREGATCPVCCLQLCICPFQSTPPRRGDASKAKPSLREQAEFQSTPPRRGDDAASSYWSSSAVFQSTPPRRGDCRAAGPACRGKRFNPRPREGATTAAWSVGDHLRFQSTPPRRGDSGRARSMAALPMFQSTPPRRGDMVRRSSLPAPCSRFQSTPPRRGDVSFCASGLSVEGFNPRPREGATLDPVIDTACPGVSIHAPAKGRQGVIRVLGPLATVSIHAPAKGRPPFLRPKSMTPLGFNPRPREGATSGLDPVPLILEVSIHAPAKGRRSDRAGRRPRS